MKEVVNFTKGLRRVFQLEAWKQSYVVQARWKNLERLCNLQSRLLKKHLTHFDNLPLPIEEKKSLLKKIVTEKHLVAIKTPLDDENKDKTSSLMSSEASFVDYYETNKSLLKELKPLLNLWNSAAFHKNKERDKLEYNRSGKQVLSNKLELYAKNI